MIAYDSRRSNESVFQLSSIIINYHRLSCTVWSGLYAHINSPAKLRGRYDRYEICSNHNSILAIFFPDSFRTWKNVADFLGQNCTKIMTCSYSKCSYHTNKKMSSEFSKTDQTIITFKRFFYNPGLDHYWTVIVRVSLMQMWLLAFQSFQNNCQFFRCSANWLQSGVPFTRA